MVISRAALMPHRGSSCILPMLLAGVLLLVCAHAAAAQSAENVAVVVNDNSPDSQRVAEYYIRRRAIPSPNVIRIRTSVEETIERAQYSATIELPITEALSVRGLQDRILYIVLTKGVPLRIAGDGGVQGS